MLSLQNQAPTCQWCFKIYYQSKTQILQFKQKLWVWYTNYLAEPANLYVLEVRRGGCNYPVVKWMNKSSTVFLLHCFTSRKLKYKMEFKRINQLDKILLVSSFLAASGVFILSLYVVMPIQQNCLKPVVRKTVSF